MQTNIRDIENEKHIQMSRCELNEFVARVADKVFNDDSDLSEKIIKLMDLISN